jgi:hypothetical protein
MMDRHTKYFGMYEEHQPLLLGAETEDGDGKVNIMAHTSIIFHSDLKPR